MGSPSIPHYLTLFLHQQSISSSPSLLNMATMLKSLSFFVILSMVNSLFFIGTTEARPFNIMKSGNSAASRGTESFFDGLSLGGIKDGSSPGVVHGFTNSDILGGIKEGPSPCCGNKYTTSTKH